MSAIVQFFDCAVETTLRTETADWSVNDGRDQGPEGTHQAPANSTAPMPARLEVTARALILRRDWRPGTYAWCEVEWRVPGPREGCFATYDRWTCEDDEYRWPKGIPCTLIFVADSDSKVAEARLQMQRDGLSPDVTEIAVGWGYEERPRWRGQEAVKPFPDIDRVQSYGSEPEYRTALPLVLDLGEQDCLTLNPDALGTLVVSMPIEHLQQLATEVAQGQGLIGYWSGHLLLRRGEPSVIAMSSEELCWWTASRQAVAQQRFQHELGRVFRAARSEWEPRLPPVAKDRWRRSPIHIALRDALPGIARQSLREKRNDERRKQVFRDALEIARGARLALSLLNETGSLEEELLAKARSLVEADKDPTYDFWPLHTLGTGGIDPVSMDTLSRQHSSGNMASLDSLEGLAQSYERLPGLWSAGLTRALVHGLLAAETGRFLGRPRPDFWWNRALYGDKDAHAPDLTRVALQAGPEEFLNNPKLKALREAQVRQRRRARRASGRAFWFGCFLWGAIGAGLGVGPGGWIGAIASFGGGMKIGSILYGRHLLAAERLPVRRLADAMQSACKVARQQRLPLPSLAVDLLRGLPDLGNYVFTTHGHKPVSGLSKAKARADTLSGVVGWRLHDARRSLATGLAKLVTPPHVVGEILNHAPAGITRQVYDRYSYEREVGEALERWAAYLQGIIRGGAGVVPIRSAG